MVATVCLAHYSITRVGVGGEGEMSLGRGGIIRVTAQYAGEKPNDKQDVRGCL